MLNQATLEQHLSTGMLDQGTPEEPWEPGMA